MWCKNSSLENILNLRLSRFRSVGSDTPVPEADNDTVAGGSEGQTLGLHAATRVEDLVSGHQLPNAKAVVTAGAENQVQVPVLSEKSKPLWSFNIKPKQTPAFRSFHTLGKQCLQFDSGGRQIVLSGRMSAGPAGSAPRSCSPQWLSQLIHLGGRGKWPIHHPTAKGSSSWKRKKINKETIFFNPAQHL